MPQKQPWPPPIVSRDGRDYIRIYRGPSDRYERLLGPTGSDQAKKEYARILAELDAGIRVQFSASITISEIGAEFLKAMQASEHASIFANIKAALKPALELYGHARAIDFGPNALRTCREQWISAGYCRNSCNRHAGIIRRWFKWCASREMIPPTLVEPLKHVEPLTKGRSKAIESQKIRPARDEDIDKTLPHLPPIVADMVRLQRLTGARPGEICALRPCDIERPWLKINDVDVWLYRLDEHKNDWRDQPRWIPLGPKAQALLRPYLDRNRGDYCFSPREVYLWWCENNDRTPNLNRKSRIPGLGYNTQAYDRCVRKACRRARVKWTPNQIRHSTATRIETLYSREDARCFLGHDNPSTTAIYAEGTERAARIAAKEG